MQVTNYLEDVVVWAPAKLNLFLEVLGKRPDGYHEIATLMVALRLYDTLIFRNGTSAEISLQCNMPELSTGGDNLVVRAARLLQQRRGCQRGARIRLVKRIPMAAGLAGGSTDAAATLVGLNRLWQLGMTTGELAALSAELGSDIPFFFHTPAAWCTGRGEIVTPVSIGAPLDIVLLCPPFGMATAAVYKNVVIPQAPATGREIRDALAQGDIDQIGRLLHNRLEEAAVKADSRLAEYPRLLAEQKPAGQAMSGSGSTFYAVCRSSAEAERLVTALQKQPTLRGCKFLLTRTL